MDESYKLPWPCKFCNGKAEYTPLQEMDSKGIGIYFCYPCQTEYCTIKKTRYLISHNIYADLNDKKYKWTHTSNGEYAHLYLVKNPGTPGVKPNREHYIIQSFHSKNDNLPTITPDNVHHKLRILLMLI